MTMAVLAPSSAISYHHSPNIISAFAGVAHHGISPTARTRHSKTDISFFIGFSPSLKEFRFYILLITAV